MNLRPEWKNGEPFKNPAQPTLTFVARAYAGAIDETGKPEIAWAVYLMDEDDGSLEYWGEGY
jgi:hypothetical protein